MDNWVKLAQRYFQDPKIRGLDDAAELMFVRGLARAGELGKRGFIPEVDLPLLTRRRRYRACVDALLAAGLWSRDGDGYRITAWDEWQEELDALTKRRTADRERKRRQRAADRQSFFARNGSQCRRCGSTEKVVIDHIIPRSRGGSDTEDNKQPLCWSCNAEKRNLTEAEYDAYLRSLVDVGALSADKLKYVRSQRERETKNQLQVGDTGTTRLSTGEPPPVDNPANPNGKPPRYCDRHPTGTAEKCIPCMHRRLAFERWETEQAAAKAERERQARASPRCPTCTHPTASSYHRRVCATDPTGAP